MLRAEEICNRFRNPDLYVQDMVSLARKGLDPNEEKNKAAEVGKLFNYWLEAGDRAKDVPVTDNRRATFERWLLGSGLIVASKRVHIVCPCIGYATVLDLLVFQEGEPVGVEIITGAIMDPSVQFPLLAAKIHAYIDYSKDTGVRRGILLQVQENSCQEWHLNVEEVSASFEVFKKYCVLYLAMQHMSVLGMECEKTKAGIV